MSERIGRNDIADDRMNCVVVLIDGGSLFRAATQLSLEVDYEKLLPCLLKGRELVRAIFYTGFSPGNLKQASFLKWMRNNGYRVLQKELTVNSDGSRRANLGVEIAIDMLQFARANDKIGVIILVSHNNDLCCIAEKISTQGLQLEIVSVTSLIQESLLNCADRFIDLESIQNEIRKSSNL
jgi:uncharacterized LabA/DUF88 family protein